MIMEKLIDNWYPKMDCIYEEKLLNLENQNYMQFIFLIALIPFSQSIIINELLNGIIGTSGDGEK